MAKNQVLTGKNGVNDKLTGADGDDQLYGLGGDDQLKGGGGNDRLYGGEGRDQLEGGAGKDLLDGGLGADTMKGGKDSDAYVVDDAGDMVIENAGEGELDSVVSSISYTLTENVENLALTGAANLAGTGNGLNNGLAGNSGDNVLHGLGGNDVLIGLGGNDKLYGDEGNDLLTGGSGNDVLDGGAGRDIMTGWGGNDSYFVDQSGDLVFELSNGGIDTVTSTVSWTLGNNLENLTLAGSASINGTGNSLANVITANAGVNQLKGGAGADSFVFNGPNTNPANHDAILDFKSAEGDKIDLTALLGAQDLRFRDSTPLSHGVWQTGDQLNIDLNGDTQAEIVIDIAGIGAKPLVLGDFKGVVAAAPALHADPYTIMLLEDSSATFDVFGNNSGTALSLAVDGTPPQHGLLQFAMPGQFTYQPDENFFGLDTFNYRLTNADGEFSVGTVSLSVTPVNDAPVGENEQITLYPGETHQFSAADFSFSDPADAASPNGLSSIRITHATAGLTYGETPIGPGDVLLVPASQLSPLSYTGTPGVAGSFQFELIDDGGTANGGVNTSASYVMHENPMSILQTESDGKTYLDAAGQHRHVLAAASFDTGYGKVPYVALLDGVGNAGTQLTDGTQLYFYAAPIGFTPDSIALLPSPFLANVDLGGVTKSGDGVEIPGKTEGVGISAKAGDATLQIYMDFPYSQSEEHLRIFYSRDGQSMILDVDDNRNGLDDISVHYTANFQTPFQPIYPGEFYQTGDSLPGNFFSPFLEVDLFVPLHAAV